MRLWYFLIVLHAHRRGSAGGGGGGVQAHPPQLFFSHQLNLRFFSKKTIIFQDSRVGQLFPGGGGGGGGFTGCPSIRIEITCYFPRGGFGPPFPPLDPRMKTVTLQMLCSWSEDVHIMCFGHHRQIIFSVTFL